jgi:hypothetical protein
VVTHADSDHQYRPLNSYLDRLPGHRGGRRPHPSTALRWVTVGQPTPDGNRVRLRAVRIGGRWFSTDVWFAEWVEVLTRAHIPTEQQTPTDGQAPAAGVLRSPTQRQKAADAAVRALEELGA